MSQPTVFFAVYRAFSVRYLLDSDIFRELARRPVRIVVLHPDHQHARLRERFGAGNVSFEPFPLDESRRLLKEYPPQVLLNRIRYFTYGGQRDSTTGTRRIFEGYFGANAPVGRALAWLLRRSRALRRGLVRLESALIMGREAQPLFERYRPSVLVASSVGYALDSPLMRLARRNGCRVVSVVHSWDNPSSKGYRGAIPDKAVAWNPIMADELVRFHDLDPAQVFVGGVAHWDRYFAPGAGGAREAFLARHRIPAGRRVVFYAPSGFKHVRTTLDAVEALLGRIARGELGDVHLVLRLHPNYFVPERGKWAEKIEQDLARVERLEAAFGERLSVSRPVVERLDRETLYPSEDMDAYAALLRHSDVLVTEYSTMLLEACIFDLPVVNVSFHRWRDTGLGTAETVEQFDHLKRVLATGAVRQARSEQELVDGLRAYLADRTLDAGARRRVVDQEIPVNRGRAGRAIADYVFELASS